MRLNNLKPAEGSTHSGKRVGRGPGSGLGKTCGRGHKGQKSRSGGFHKVGFEGGQMPLQRRLPKVGFTSRKSLVSQEVRLSELNKIDGDVVSLETLKAANLIKACTKFVKIMKSGELSKKLTIAANVAITKGAQAAVTKAGGKVEAEK